jgi:hypothetical protein
LGICDVVYEGLIVVRVAKRLAGEDRKRVLTMRMVEVGFKRLRMVGVDLRGGCVIMVVRR